MKRGPVFRELWTKRHRSFESLYYVCDPRGRTTRPNRSRLKDGALDVLRGAFRQVSGMGPGEYWLAESMSEAIEAAEALGL